MKRKAVLFLAFVFILQLTAIAFVFFFITSRYTSDGVLPFDKTENTITKTRNNSGYNIYADIELNDDYLNVVSNISLQEYKNRIVLYVPSQNKAETDILSIKLSRGYANMIIKDC